MNSPKRLSNFILAVVFLLLAVAGHTQGTPAKPVVNDSGYFEKRGLNVFVFSNRYGLFGDEKASGVEIIHHGVRTATNGDVRMAPTPGDCPLAGWPSPRPKESSRNRIRQERQDDLLNENKTY